MMRRHRAHILLLLLLLLPLAAGAQEPVAPVSRWMATVDSASQQIMLRWRPSSDSNTMGYHICTGMPCVDYDTVFGRLDTTYICLDHSPLETHTYRIHVFDSARNVSALTPPFGNMVVQAEVPECETSVDIRWNPYTGMPDGQPLYRLQVKLEPFYDHYTDFYTTRDSNALHHSFEMSEAVTRVWLRVVAEGDSGWSAQSNIVAIERRTVDSASVVEIDAAAYDSVDRSVVLQLQTDPDFEYTLYRSIDGTPWRAIATLDGGTARYIDRDIDPYDSLHCYQLGVLDACGMNEHYSSTRCVVVPDPPQPAAWFPNIIVVDGSPDGCFRPVLQGLNGDLYELAVYNRSGMLVYQTTDPNAGWTPSDQTPQGAYTYRLRCRYNTESIKTYTGTVLLIK